MLNYVKELYLLEGRQREIAQNLEHSWLVREALAAGGRDNGRFLARISQGLHTLGQVRKIRVEVSFVVQEPCPEGANS